MNSSNNAMNNSQQNDPADFINRYQQNPNAIPQQELSDRYQQVASQMSPADYQQVAQQVFDQMSPQERMQFAQSLMQQAQQQGYSFPDVNQDGIDDCLQDPNQLAQMTAHAQQQQPGMMNQLLNGDARQSMTNALGSPVAKGVMGGIAAYGLSRLIGGSGGHNSGLLGGLSGGNHERDRDDDRGWLGGVLGNGEHGNQGHSSGHGSRHGGGHSEGHGSKH